MDQPVPDHVARIAESLGQPLQWNRQYVVGSSIKTRTRGFQRETGWAGYSTGYNRQGEGLNLVEEFRKPSLPGGNPYDTLVITEQHSLLDSLLFNDTVRHLRHYHERFIEGNAQGQTWFYEPWIGVIDKSNPSRWLAYERAAAPVWQCIVTRINTSLAAEGRPDRLRSYSASLVLVSLVERAVRGEVPSLSAKDTQTVMNRIFQDNVHASPLGAYYVALGLYAALSDRSPVGAWAPEPMSPQLAASLQQLAWEAVQAQKSRPVLPLDRCQDAVKTFMPTYFDYMRDDYWAQQPASWRNTSRRLRNQLTWRWRVWQEFDGDLFRYQAATDKAYWFPAP